MCGSPWKWEGDDCLGTPHTWLDSNFLSCINFDTGIQFYTGGSLLEDENFTYQGGSSRSSTDGVCRNIDQSGGSAGPFYEVVEIPSTEIPFNLPLVPPFNFK